MSSIANEIFPFPGTMQGSQAISLPAAALRSFQEGMQYLQAGEPATAVAELSQSLEHAPDFAPTHILLGIAHALTSNIYPAIDHLETARQLEPDSFAAHFTQAQLSFKLRIPKKGYEAAERARRCIRTVEQRKMLTNLLKEEKARERNGVARPTFDKPFSRTSLIIAAGCFLGILSAIAISMY